MQSRLPNSNDTLPSGVWVALTGVMPALSACVIAPDNVKRLRFCGLSVIAQTNLTCVLEAALLVY